MGAKKGQGHNTFSRSTFNGPVIVGDVQGSIFSQNAPEANRKTQEFDGDEANNPARQGISLCANIDIVAYRSRTNFEQRHLQQRLEDIRRNSLAQLRIRPSEVKKEPRGDGANLIFPPSFSLRNQFEALVVAIHGSLKNDNSGHKDRMRLRIGFDIGEATDAALGVDGSAIIRACGIGESAELREAMGRADADLGFAISEPVASLVVDEGCLPMYKNDLRRVQVTLKQNQIVDARIAVLP